MKIDIVGGGPAGLYFAILAKKADPSHEITVHERNGRHDTFGFGVVFSDAALDTLRAAYPETHDEITRHFAHWDDIEIHYRGHVLRSGGHGFSGISRQKLIDILVARAKALGAKVVFHKEVADIAALKAQTDLLVGADGANSAVRSQLAFAFKPATEWRPNRFVWLGTDFPFPAFTFHFKENEHGLWRVHAYRYDKGHSTFIVETTESTWRAAGLEKASEDDTLAFCTKLFSEELAGHKLLKNKSVWRAFPIIRNDRWSHENVVLLGDAAHTTHWSIGSGTKLAMEDALALSTALHGASSVAEALANYERDRRPTIESFQRSARVSLQWFEDTERYMAHEPIRFGFSLLTRSFRVTHDELMTRDPAYVKAVDEWFAKQTTKETGLSVPTSPAPPPMFTPFKLRDMVLSNRIVVSPMCMYSAEDGTINDWHLVHLGSRAVGGAGLVIAEMTDVSPEGRITHGCAGLYKDEHVEAWKRVVDFAHKYTQAKMGIQLGHAGRKASTKRPWEAKDEALGEDGWTTFAPSAIPWRPGFPAPVEMTRQHMDQVIQDHVDATKRADKAGFDHLEIHNAHGYLLASFLSPLTNQRKDEYGGSLDNQLRFPLEVFDAVRAAWPSRKPMSVRISATDWVDGGFTGDMAVHVGRVFKEHGCDIIDVSAGQTVPYAKPPYGRQFQTPFSERVRLEADIPTMAVGNISSFMDVNTILAAGRADLAVMARAHLWDPYWTRHAANALDYPLEWPDPYKSLSRYTPRMGWTTLDRE
jgi:anthraniloyl-CoA monooxygenase